MAEEYYRDNQWLKGRLELLWQRYFSDIQLANTLFVRFGRKNRTRLGTIKFGRRKENPNTYITVNGHFRDPNIPEFVIDVTLVHELAHYSHGFFSPHPQKEQFPHRGSVVNRELTKRGLDDIVKMQKRWLKENWEKFLKANHK